MKAPLRAGASRQSQRLAFEQRVAEYRDWLARYGAEPSDRSPRLHERALAGWMYRTRSAERAETLPPAHAAALDVTTEWWRPAYGELRAAHFQARVAQLSRFVDEQR